MRASSKAQPTSQPWVERSTLTSPSAHLAHLAFRECFQRPEDKLQTCLKHKCETNQSHVSLILSGHNQNHSWAERKRGSGAMSSGRTVILQFETAKQRGLEHITRVSVLPFLLGKKVPTSSSSLLHVLLPQGYSLAQRVAQTPS